MIDAKRSQCSNVCQRKIGVSTNDFKKAWTNCLPCIHKTSVLMQPRNGVEGLVPRHVPARDTTPSAVHEKPYVWQDVEHEHSVHRISFIARDLTDRRAFGYIFGAGEGKHKFFGIKTAKIAEHLVLALRDLFQVVYDQKKKEMEEAKKRQAEVRCSVLVTDHDVPKICHRGVLAWTFLLLKNRATTNAKRLRIDRADAQCRWSCGALPTARTPRPANYRWSKFCRSILYFACKPEGNSLLEPKRNKLSRLAVEFTTSEFSAWLRLAEAAFRQFTARLMSTRICL